MRATTKVRIFLSFFCSNKPFKMYCKYIFGAIDALLQMKAILVLNRIFTYISEVNLSFMQKHFNCNLLSEDNHIICYHERVSISYD